MTTAIPLDFFPELVTGAKPLNTRLAGLSFPVEPGTPVEKIGSFGLRPLIKVSTPKVGYRFAGAGEITKS
jgi:hypothetical protein